MEYAGSAVRNLSMEGRLTLCNLSIEMGARGGMAATSVGCMDLSEGVFLSNML